MFKLGLIKPDKPLRLCFESLDKVTLRLPADYETDSLAGLRIVKRVLEKLFSNEVSYVRFDDTGNHSAIIDISHQQSELRKNYVEHFSGIKQDALISKEGLISFNNAVGKCKGLIHVSVFFWPLFIASLFSKRKYHWPLLLMESIESDMLLRLVKAHHIKNLHYFCIYERDANLNAYLLMQNGVYVNKIPSEVPLAFWNKTIVSNSLSFCFAYQEEEYNNFRDTICVDEVKFWAPEKAIKAPQRFFSKGRTKTEFAYDIGFYSSGMWLRKQENSKFQDDSSVEREEWLLNELFNFCKTNGRTLRIYTHPIEKWIDKREKTQHHYQGYLEHAGVSIQDFDRSSNEEFDEVNIGIALFSTLMFERIYFGFKTLLLPLNIAGFPIKESSFENICVTEQKQLMGYLDKNIALSAEDFYKACGTLKYSPFLITQNE